MTEIIDSLASPITQIRSHNQKTNNTNVTPIIHTIKRLKTFNFLPPQSCHMHTMKWQKRLIPWHYLHPFFLLQWMLKKAPQRDYIWYKKGIVILRNKSRCPNVMCARIWNTKMEDIGQNNATVKQKYNIIF